MATKKEMLKHEQWIREIVREEIKVWWESQHKETKRRKPPYVSTSDLLPLLSEKSHDV
jgi:hypothetical protein